MRLLGIHGMLKTLIRRLLVVMKIKLLEWQSSRGKRRSYNNSNPFSYGGEKC